MRSAEIDSLIEAIIIDNSELLLSGIVGKDLKPVPEVVSFPEGVPVVAKQLVWTLVSDKVHRFDLSNRILSLLELSKGTV